MCSYDVLNTKSLKKFLALILTQNTFLDILQEWVHTQNYLFIFRLPVSMGTLGEKPGGGAPPLPMLFSLPKQRGPGGGVRWRKAADWAPGVVTITK